MISRTIINGKQQNVLKTNVKREGDHAADSADIVVDASVAVKENDDVKVQFDKISMDGLKLCWTFAYSLIDESLHGNDVVVSNPQGNSDLPAYYTERHIIGVQFRSSWKRAIIATAPVPNALGSTFISSGDDFTLVVRMWIGEAGKSVLRLHNNFSAISIIDFVKRNDRLEMEANGRVVGSIVVSPHWITLTLRNKNGVMDFRVDGESVKVNHAFITQYIMLGTSIVNGAVQYVNAGFAQFRVYDRYLTDKEVGILEKGQMPYHITWFGGNVQRVEDRIDTKRLTVQSYGGLLNNIEVFKTEYADSTVNDIVSDLIGKHTNFKLQIGAGSNPTIKNYTAKGNMIDILTELAGRVDNTWYIDSLQVLHWEGKGNIPTKVLYEHGRGCTVEYVETDSEHVVNEILLLGKPQVNTRHLFMNTVMLSNGASATRASRGAIIYGGLRAVHRSSGLTDEGVRNWAAVNTYPFIPIAVRFTYIDTSAVNNYNGYNWGSLTDRQIRGLVHGDTYETWQRYGGFSALAPESELCGKASSVLDEGSSSQKYEIWILWNGGRSNRGFNRLRPRSSRGSYTPYFQISNSNVGGSERRILHIEYDYNAQSVARVSNQASQQKVGKKTRRVNVNWSFDEDEGIEFATDLLGAYGRLNKSYKITVFGLEHRMLENSIVRVRDPIRGIDTDAIVKSIEWDYPAAQTTLLCGEYSRDEYDSRKETLAKLHAVGTQIERGDDLENDLASNLDEVAFKETTYGGAVVAGDQMALSEEVAVNDR